MFNSSPRSNSSNNNSSSNVAGGGSVASSSGSSAASSNSSSSAASSSGGSSGNSNPSSSPRRNQKLSRLASEDSYASTTSLDSVTASAGKYSTKRGKRLSGLWALKRNHGSSLSQIYSIKICALNVGRIWDLGLFLRKTLTNLISRIPSLTKWEKTVVAVFATFFFLFRAGAQNKWENCVFSPPPLQFLQQFLLFSSCDFFHFLKPPPLIFSFQVSLAQSATKTDFQKILKYFLGKREYVNIETTYIRLSEKRSQSVRISCPSLPTHSILFPLLQPTQKKKKKEKTEHLVSIWERGGGRMITDIFGPMHKFGKSGWAFSQTEDRGRNAVFVSVCGKSGGTT